MIRVTDSVAGTDIAYNFGMFDFNQENFYWNFAQGRMMYSMDAAQTAWELVRYGRSGRSIEEQVLALTPGQARSLAHNLARNAEPDQMFYRYDYYRDNCSTRVRDALNVVLAGTLDGDLSVIPTTTTYRSRTAELTADNPALYFGLMVLLGPGGRPSPDRVGRVVHSHGLRPASRPRACAGPGRRFHAPGGLRFLRARARGEGAPFSMRGLFGLWLALGVVHRLAAGLDRAGGVGRGGGGGDSWCSAGCGACCPGWPG